MSKLSHNQKRKKKLADREKIKNLKRGQLIDFLQIIRNPPEHVANAAYFSMVINNKRVFSELNIVKQSKDQITMNVSGETKQLLKELSKQTA